MDFFKTQPAIQMKDLIETALKEKFSHKPKLINSVLSAEEYSILAGGKRVRPMLVLLFCEACGVKSESFAKVASSIEMIHSFSLIHDDLPCMDNDDYRRGLPSCHKKFGEATALLAGDALSVLAFEVISDEAMAGVISYEKAIKLISILAKATGPYGMIGGQIIDLASEGKEISKDTLYELQAKKTGALINAACSMGCILADREDLLPYAYEYADSLGLAFQIVDDILDVEGSFEELGKPIGSDEAQNKTTFVSLYGLEKAKKTAHELTNRALSSLKSFESFECLEEMTKALLVRKN